MTALMLVTVEQVKTRLRIDHDSEDTDLALMIRSASRAVMNYLKMDAEDFYDSAGEFPTDSAGEPTDVDEEIQQAALMLVGLFYRDRSGDNRNDWDGTTLPAPVVSVLYPLRQLTLA